MSRGVRAWAPAILWAVVLFALSSRPTLPVGLGGGLDKVAHFGAFAVLGFLLARAAIASNLSIVWPLLIGLVYAASDEIHQYFVPGRHPDPADWLADALGVAVACIFVYRSRFRRHAQHDAVERAPADPIHR